MISREQLPDTTAIICSRGRPELLRDCVESVLNGHDVPRELIIVDDSDAENDALAALATDRSCDVRYYWRRGRGLSSAMNFAIEKSRHDVLVFTQDDAEVEATWLARIVHALLEAGPKSIVTGQVRPGDPEGADEFVSAVNVGQERMVFRGRTDRDVLYALNMALWKSAVEEIGPFDERLGPGTPFPGSEDSDFAFRALEAGYSIVNEPAAVVRHRAWRGQERFLKFRWGYGFARGGFYAKYISGHDGYMLGRLWRDVRDHVVPVPRLFVSDRNRAFGHLALAAGVVAGAIRWAVTERRSQNSKGSVFTSR